MPAIPFRRTADGDAPEEEEWKPPDWATPVGGSSDEWKPPSWATPVKAKEASKPSVFSRVASALSPAKSIHPTAIKEALSEDTSKPISEKKQFSSSDEYTGPTTFWGGFGQSIKRQVLGEPGERTPLEAGAHPKTAGDMASLLLMGEVPNIRRALGAAKNLSNVDSVVSKVAKEELPIRRARGVSVEEDASKETPRTQEFIDPETNARKIQRQKQVEETKPSEKAPEPEKPKGTVKNPFEKKTDAKPTVEFQYNDPMTGEKTYKVSGGEYDGSHKAESSLKKLGFDIPKHTPEEEAALEADFFKQRAASQDKLKASNDFAKSALQKMRGSEEPIEFKTPELVDEGAPPIRQKTGDFFKDDTNRMKDEALSRRSDPIQVAKDKEVMDAWNKTQDNLRKAKPMEDSMREQSGAAEPVSEAHDWKPPEWATPVSDANAAAKAEASSEVKSAFRQRGEGKAFQQDVLSAKPSLSQESTATATPFESGQFAKYTPEQEIANPRPPAEIPRARQSMFSETGAVGDLSKEPLSGEPKLSEPTKFDQEGTLPSGQKARYKLKEPESSSSIRDRFDKMFSGLSEQKRPETPKSTAREAKLAEYSDYRKNEIAAGRQPVKYGDYEVKTNVARSGLADEKGELKIPEFLTDSSKRDSLLTMASKSANTMKSMQNALSLAAPLRHGAGLIYRKEFYPAFRDMFKYFGNKEFYNNAMQAIEEHPNFPLFKASGGFMSKAGTANVEEEFLNSYVGNIPKFTGIPQTVAASQRGYTGFLNKLRFDTFNGMTKTMKSLGYETHSMVGSDIIPSKMTKSINKFINNATGRGDLPGNLNKVTNELNMLMWSPRMISSRVQMFANPKLYMDLPKGMRLEGVKSLLGIAGMGLAINGLASMAGAKMGTNPLSTDFMKSRFGGNKVVDPNAGLQQYVVAASRFLAGKTDSKMPTSRLEIAGRFAANKESPALNLVHQLLTAKEFSGKGMMLDKFTDQYKNETSIHGEIAKRFTPIFLQDIQELMQSEPDFSKNIGLDVAMGAASLAGMSQSYPERKSGLKLGMRKLAVR